MYFQQRPQNVVNDGFALIEYTKSSEAWDGDIQIHALYLGIYTRVIWEMRGRSLEGNRHKPAVNLLQDNLKECTEPEQEGALHKDQCIQICAGKPHRISSGTFSSPHFRVSNLPLS